jgi:hypothetical protein
MKTLAEKLRHEIETCGMSRYSISQSTGIEEASLCRFMQGGSLKIETADKLLEYFGYEIKKKARRK